jgi:hypothetical protein
MAYPLDEVVAGWPRNHRKKPQGTALPAKKNAGPPVRTGVRRERLMGNEKWIGRRMHGAPKLEEPKPCHQLIKEIPRPVNIENKE